MVLGCVIVALLGDDEFVCGKASVSGEEAGGGFGKFLMKLEMRAVPRVRKKDEAGVGKVLLKNVRVHGGDHDVVMTVHHEGPLANFFQIGVALAGDPAPFRERG
jgi:hypothetical protein